MRRRPKCNQVCSELSERSVEACRVGHSPALIDDSSRQTSRGLDPRFRGVVYWPHIEPGQRGFDNGVSIHSMRALRSDESGFPSPQAWDAMLRASPQGHLLQSWAWGEFKSRFGWRALRVAVEDGGELVAGAQILLRRLPYRCLAYVPKGPCLDPSNEKHVDLLWTAVHRVARAHGAIALKVEPECEDGADDGWLLGQGFRPSTQTIQPRRTIIVDLDEDDDRILARMKSMTRYNVRLASRRGIEVCPGSEADLSKFYDLMKVTGQRDRFAVHSAEYYRTAWQLLADRGHGVLLVARYGDELVAGIMVFSFGSSAYYFYGASANEHRNRMPNHALQWAAMRWAKERGCRHYDLWGIPDVEPGSPTAALTGVQRFKEGFGGRVVRYIGAYDRVYSRTLHTLLNWAWAGRRRIFS